jgi:hypothetical protein
MEESTVKTKDFIKESELSDLDDAYTKQTGLIGGAVDTVAKDLGKAGKSLKDIVQQQAGITKGLAVTTPTAGERASEKTDADEKQQQVKKIIASGQPLQIDPRVKDYVQKMAQGKKAANSTGTAEIDSVLKSLGLMD